MLRIGTRATKLIFSPLLLAVYATSSAAAAGVSNSNSSKAALTGQVSQNQGQLSAATAVNASVPGKALTGQVSQNQGRLSAATAVTAMPPAAPSFRGLVNAASASLSGAGYSGAASTSGGACTVNLQRPSPEKHCSICRNYSASQQTQMQALRAELRGVPFPLHCPICRLLRDF
jgi:hypothetical protein